jgi:hypothetical protein
VRRDVCLKEKGHIFVDSNTSFGMKNRFCGDQHAAPLGTIWRYYSFAGLMIFLM